MHREPCKTFITCDSSPQGKLDWLMGMCCWVPHKDLVMLYEAARALWSQAQRREESLEGEVVHINVLQDALEWQVLTPTAIASGRASAGHKMKALLWPMYLQSSWGEVANNISDADFYHRFRH